MSTLQQSVSLVILISTEPASTEIKHYQVDSLIQYVKKKIKSKELPFHKKKEKLQK